MATVKVSASEITILPPELEMKVNQEIAATLEKENVTKKVIETLRNEYMPLKINGQEDKEGYTIVVEARKNVKVIRVAAKKAFKAGREEANLVAQKWISAEKPVIADLEEIEGYLETMEKAWEAERDRVKAERNRLLAAQERERMAELMGFGAVLDDDRWVLGEVSYEAVLIKEADPEIYEGIKAQYKAEYDKKEESKAAEAEKKRLEQEKLLQQQEEVKKMQQEAKKMRTDGRCSFLLSLGLSLNHSGTAYIYSDIAVPISSVEDHDAQDWEVAVAGVSQRMAEIKVENQKREAMREIFRTRMGKLKEWSSNGQSVYAKGYIWGTVEDLVSLTEEAFEDLFRENNAYIMDREKARAEQEKINLENARLEGVGKSRREVMRGVSTEPAISDLELGSIEEIQWKRDYDTAKFLYDQRQQSAADQREKERKELLGEKQKYEELVAAIKAIQVPVLKSGQYRGKANIIRDFIDGLK